MTQHTDTVKSYPRLDSQYHLSTLTGANMTVFLDSIDPTNQVPKEVLDRYGSNKNTKTVKSCKIQ